MTNASKGPYVSLKGHRRLAWFCVGMALLLVGCSIPPNIRLSTPRVYQDDQARKVFAQRSRDLHALVKEIDTKELQELSSTTQSTRVLTTLSVSPAGSSPPTAAPNAETAKEKPSKAVESNVGLPYESLLRQRVARDQAVLNYELLYMGDSHTHDSTNRLLLVRYDVSILDYVEDMNSFARIQFRINRLTEDIKHKKTKPEALLNDQSCKDDDLKVYAMGPEYSAVVSQDSLLTSMVLSYEVLAGAKMKALDAKLGSQHESDLQEFLLSATERPTQFVVYGNCPNEFGVAFGPRRRIEKRSWINPMRIFGNTYTDTSTLEPGVRSFYALFVLPNEDGADFVITSALPEVYEKYNRTQSRLRILDAIGKVYDSIPSPLGSITKASLNLAKTVVKEQCRTAPPPRMDVITIPLSNPSKEWQDNVNPAAIYPALSNSLILTSAKPVSSQTQVFIGPLSVPRTDVTLLNRHEIVVTIRQEAGLALLHDLTKSSISLDVVIVTPDQDSSHKIGTVTLTRYDTPVLPFLKELIPRPSKPRDDPDGISTK